MVPGLWSLVPGLWSLVATAELVAAQPLAGAAHRAVGEAVGLPQVLRELRLLAEAQLSRRHLRRSGKS